MGSDSALTASSRVPFRVSVAVHGRSAARTASPPDSAVPASSLSTEQCQQVTRSARPRFKSCPPFSCYVTSGGAPPPCTSASSSVGGGVDSSPAPVLCSQALLGFLGCPEPICQCPGRAVLPTPPPSPRVLGPPGLSRSGPPPGTVQGLPQGTLRLDWQREEEGKEKRIEFHSGGGAQDHWGCLLWPVRVAGTSLPC